MDTKKLTKIFKALSNDNRLELYLQIVSKHEACFERNEECFLTDIIASLNIGAPTISHHLKELANAELIYTERKGKYLVCKLNDKAIADVTKVLEIINNKKG